MGHTMGQVSTQSPFKAISPGRFELSAQQRYLSFLLIILLLWAMVARASGVLVPAVGDVSEVRLKAGLINSLVRLGLMSSLALLGFLPVGIYKYFKAERSSRKPLIISFLRKSAETLKYLPFAILSYILLIYAYMSFKTLIPNIIPFYFDPIAAKMDRVLFLGNEGWEVFGFLYQFRGIVDFIDLSYAMWIPICTAIWCACIALPFTDSFTRYRYCLSVILLWIIGGNILAVLFSTSGPVYYDYFFGSDVFEPMMAKLHQIHETNPLNAVLYQSTLMEYYNTPATRMGGISAMPSLHNGNAFLFICVLWKFPIARALAQQFMVLVFVGSIILGWHYAVDGILAIGLAWLCWNLAGKILKAIDKRAESRSGQTA